MNKLKKILSTTYTFYLNTKRELGNCIYNAFNSPQFVWSILFNRYFSKRNSISVSISNCRFCQCKATITGFNNKLNIENGCNFKGLKLNLNNGEVIFCKSTINASWEYKVRISATNGCTISIGYGCLLSDNIQIHTTDYHSIFDNNNNICNMPNNISIGNHVWICKDVMVLKGANIPDGCVVGARSIINKHFNSSNSIIAGIPGKVIRENIHWGEN